MSALCWTWRQSCRGTDRWPEVGLEMYRLGKVIICQHRKVHMNNTRAAGVTQWYDICLATVHPGFHPSKTALLESRAAQFSFPTLQSLTLQHRKASSRGLPLILRFRCYGQSSTHLSLLSSSYVTWGVTAEQTGEALYIAVLVICGFLGMYLSLGTHSHTHYRSFSHCWTMRLPECAHGFYLKHQSPCYRLKSL